MYKYEIHVHTNACSACGASSGIEMVDAAKEAGYSGFVLTNHFFHGNTGIDRNLPWADFVKAYADDYYIAKEYGDKVGIDVLFGLEEGFGDSKEALIYGLTPELVAATPQLANLDIAFLSDFVRKNGGFISCAHPFRTAPYISNPDIVPNPIYFDGIEVFNHFNTEAANEKAFNYAKANNLQGLAGGDVHRIDAMGTCGVAFEKRICTNEELVAALKSKAYKYITDGVLHDPVL